MEFTIPVSGAVKLEGEEAFTISSITVQEEPTSGRWRLSAFTKTAGGENFLFQPGGKTVIKEEGRD